MEIFRMLVFIFSLLSPLFQLSHSTAVAVDGVSAWKNPSVQVGDSVIFQHKFHYKVYIFRSEGAFEGCNFTEAALLSKPNSTSFTWYPSRHGLFYFSFSNGSNTACRQGQKLAINVSPAPPLEKSASSPEVSPVSAPLPSFGGVVSSSPSYPWPFQPRELPSPSPSPSAILPATSPMLPEKGGMPFINSNPAVPLPTGEVDSATIRPFPTSNGHGKQVVGLHGVQRALYCVVFLLVI